ncbi:uncharacterized protein LOC143459461 [Clavelina lepadiformis]|uniref:uncharacterized protein LOC143459461 n=1 Tax=Clavelina lepadiformis TaxID=159417 RepID=UPI004041131C
MSDLPKETLLVVCIHFLARLTIIMLNWTLLEAALQANMRQHYLGLDTTAAILYVLMWVPCIFCVIVELANLPKQKWSNRSGKRTPIVKKTEKKNPDRQRCTGRCKFSFSPKAFTKVVLTTMSSLVLFFSCYAFLEINPKLRFFLLTFGALLVPFYIRLALVDKRFSAIDIPVSLAVMMSVRCASLTLGVFHQTFAGGFALSFATFFLNFLSALHESFQKQHSDRQIGDNNKNSYVAVCPQSRETITSNTPLKIGSFVHVPNEIQVSTLFAENDNNRNHSEKLHAFYRICRQLVLILSALSVGSLTWISIFFALTPAQLTRWCGSGNPLTSGLLFAWSLTLGCTAATWKSLEHEARSLWKYAGDLSNDGFLSFFVILLWVLSVYCLFYKEQTLAVIGGCLMLACLPVTWVITLRLLKAVRRHATRRRHWKLSGLMLQAGCVTTVLTAASIFSVLPHMVPWLWNQHRAVFWIAILFILAPHFVIVLLNITCCRRKNNEMLAGGFKNRNDQRLVLRNRKTVYESQRAQNLSLTLLLLTVTACTLYSFNINDSGKVDSENRTEFRVMTWNVLQGMAFSERLNVFKTKHLIQFHKIDVIALQESYTNPVFLYGFNYAHYLSTKLGLHAHYGVNTRDFGGGDVSLLSKWPIIERHSEILPSSNIHVYNYDLSKIAVKIPSLNSSMERILWVVSVHTVFSNISKNAWMLTKPHLERIAEVIRETPDPLILMGDFNLSPSDPNLEVIYDQGVTNAFSANSSKCVSTLTNNKECLVIDYIFFRGLTLAKPSTVLKETGSASDHYPVMAQFLL